MCGEWTTLQTERLRVVRRKVVCAFAGIVLALLPFDAFVAKAPSPLPKDEILTGTLTTKPGETNCVTLPDGSWVWLNSNSVVRYIFNRKARNVELVSGEAAFVVHSKEGRPFDVLSGGVIVHDLSTSFDVIRARHSTRVTVIEGRIRMIAPINSEARRAFELGDANGSWTTAPEFHHIQQMEFDDVTGKLRVLRELTHPQLMQHLAWQRSQIVMSGQALTDVLHEFSRHQPSVRFNLADESMSGIRLGGTLKLANVDDFLTLLEVEFDIHHTARQVNGNTVITLSRTK